MHWQATIEWTADTIDPQDSAGTILDALTTHHGGAVTYPAPGRYATTISVEAGTLRQAVALALQVVTAAASNAGHRAIVPVEIDIVDEPTAHARLQRPDIPELVGYAEIADLAGVSRARARQIATDRTDFPPVAVDTGYGPLYVRQAVEAFLARPRPTGRPRKSAV